MKFSNTFCRQHRGRWLLLSASLLVAGSLVACSPDSTDTETSAKAQPAAASADESPHDSALHGQGAFAEGKQQSDGDLSRQRSVAGAASEVPVNTAPIAVGVTLQPFGPVPGPGQVQWPSDDTPKPAAAPTMSPF
jgi:hypothetical protein